MLITHYKNCGKKNIQRAFPKRSAFLYKTPTEWVKCPSKLGNAHVKRNTEIILMSANCSSKAVQRPPQVCV